MRIHKPNSTFAVIQLKYVDRLVQKIIFSSGFDFRPSNQGQLSEVRKSDPEDYVRLRNVAGKNSLVNFSQ